MWWLLGVSAYLAFLVLGILFLKAAADADDRSHRLEGTPDTKPGWSSSSNRENESGIRGTRGRAGISR
jgi:hypothetical protein